MRILLLIFTVMSISIRFMDKNNFDIPLITDYSKFRILIQDKTETILLHLANHNYPTGLQFRENYCKYVVYNVEIKDKSKNVQSNDDGLLKAKNSNVGYFDFCKNIINFDIDDYTYKYTKKRNSYEKTIKLKSSTLFDHQNSTNELSVAKSSMITPNTLKVTIINDEKRVLRHGKNIDKITQTLMKHVSNIFKKSNIKVNVMLHNTINMMEKVFRNLDDLKFTAKDLGIVRDVIDPFRTGGTLFPSFGMNRTNVIIYVVDTTQTGGLIREIPLHQGVSYFNGINYLDRPYSLLTVDDRSNLFSANKIAHEVGHLMGVEHDKRSGYIMSDREKEEKEVEEEILKEEAMEKSKSESIILFSPDSSRQIDNFALNFPFGANPNLFGHRDLITNPSNASDLISSLRSCTYDLIIKNKLNGIEPDTFKTKYFMGITLLFYLFAMGLGLFYMK